MKIVLALLLLTTVCFANELKVCPKDYVYDKAVGKCEPKYIYIDSNSPTFTTMNTFCFGTVNPPSDAWISIQGKHEQINIYCLDKKFNPNMDICSDIKIVRKRHC